MGYKHVTLNLAILCFGAFYEAYGFSAGKKVSLKEAISFSFQNNLDLGIEKIEYDKINQTKNKPIYELLPRVDLKASRSVSDNSFIKEEESYNTQISLSVTGEIDLLGSNFRAYDRNQKKIKAKEKQNNFAKSKVALNVIDSYLNLILSQKKIEVLSSDKQISRNLKKAISEKVKLGLKSKIDLLEIDLDISKNENTLIQEKNRLNNLRRSLSRLCFNNPNAKVEYQGLSSTKGPYFMLSSKIKVDNLSESNIKSYLSNRPDLEGQRLLNSTNDSAYKESYYTFLPKVAVTGVFERNLKPDLLDETTEEGDQITSQLILSFNWNLFNRGSDYLQVIENKISKKLDEANYSKVLQSSLDEIYNLQNDLVFHKSSVSNSNALLEVAQAKFKLDQSKYNLGGITAEELLKSKRELVNARVSEISANYELYKSYAKMLHSLGLLVKVI